MDITKELDLLKQRVAVLEGQHQEKDERDIFEQATEVIRSIGIPAHTLGYRYIREAIVLLYNDLSLLEAVTKELYPMIAIKYSTTPSRVERAIRHSIELTWFKATNVLEADFVLGSSGRPSNAQFLALVVDNLMIKNKQN